MPMRSLAACCLLALGTASTVLADEPPTAPLGGLSPELAVTIEARSLSPQHQQLARFAGDWTYTSKLWMGGPGAAPAESGGTLQAETMFGGRYVEQHWIGEMMGKPFEGRGTMAYDNVEKKFASTWIEMANGIGMMMQAGTCDDAMTSCTFSGLYWNPASGQQNTIRSVLTWTGEDSFKSEGYGTGPDGFEMKVVEFVVTRKR
jgi:hypothetical protein